MLKHSFAFMAAATGAVVGEFRYPSEVQYFDGMIAARPVVVVGAPDGFGEPSGGVNWAGLGNGFIVYDLLAEGTPDEPIFPSSDIEMIVHEGEGIMDRAGADLILFEAAGGAEESNLVQVEVSADFVNWVDITSSRSVGAANLPELPSSPVDGEFSSTYDVALFGSGARYVRLRGLSTRAPGQSLGVGNGFDLDTIAYYRRPAVPLWQSPAAVSSGFDFVAASVNGMIACRLGNSLEIFRQNEMEPYERVGGVEYGQEVDAYDVLSGEGIVWLSVVTLSRTSLLTVEGYRLVGGEMEADPFLSQSMVLPLLEQDGSYEIDTMLGPDGFPIGLITNGGNEAQIFQARERSALRFLSFGTVIDEAGAPPSQHTGPAIASLPDGTILVGLNNTRPLDDGGFETLGFLMPTGVNPANGEVIAPVADGPLNQVVNQRMGDVEGAQSLDPDLAISPDGKLAFVGYDVIFDRLGIGYQTMAGDPASIELSLPNGLRNAFKPSLLWKDSETLLLAAIVEVDERTHYPVLGQLEVATGEWIITGNPDFTSEVEAVGLSLVEGSPIMTMLAEGSPRAILLEDFLDVDGNGFSRIQEDAGLLSVGRIEFISNGDMTFPKFITTVPTGGQVYGVNRYSTDAFDYEFFRSPDLRGFDEDNLDTLSPLPVNDGTEVSVISQVDLAERGSQFFQIRLRRR